MEKSEVIQKKVIFTLRWSVDIKLYIFTSENIKYTLYVINVYRLLNVHRKIFGTSSYGEDARACFVYNKNISGAYHIT